MSEQPVRSAATPPPIPHSRRRTNGLLLVFLVLPVVIISIALAWLIQWRLGFRKAVDIRLAAIAAKGQPTDWKELQQWYPTVPDQENAALVYTQAFHVLKATSKPGHGHVWSDVELPRHSVELDPALLAELQTAIRSNAAALVLAHRATLMQRCRYPIDLSQGPNTQLSHLGSLRELCKLLEFEALLRIQGGQLSHAAESVIASLAISRSLLAEPTLVSQLTSTTIEDHTCRSLERVVSSGPLGNADLVRLSQWVADLESTNRYLRGVVGERAMYVEVFELAQSDPDRLARLFPDDSASDQEPESNALHRGAVKSWRALGVVERDLAFYLDAMETNLAVLALGPPASITGSERAAKKFEKDLLRPTHIFSSLLFTPSTGIAKRDAERRANLRTARIALAVERWRLANGNQVPESLAVLVPQYLDRLPPDPFDGQPMRFKRLNKGYVVYSIGRDGEDNSGREKPPHSAKLPAEQREHVDVTFTVTR